MGFFLVPGRPWYSLEEQNSLSFPCLFPSSLEELLEETDGMVLRPFVGCFHVQGKSEVRVAYSFALL